MQKNFCGLGIFTLQHSTLIAPTHNTCSLLMLQAHVKKIMIRTLLHMHMLSSAMIGTTVGFDASASVGFDASASVPQLV